MKEQCSCCQKVFEFSLSESSMGNVVSCPHCQSTLKWTDSTFEIIYNSNLGDEVNKKSSSSEEKEDQLKQEPLSVQSSLHNSSENQETLGRSQNLENLQSSPPLQEDLKSPAREENPVNGTFSTPQKEEITNYEQEPSEDSQISSHPEETKQNFSRDQSLTPTTEDDLESSQELYQSAENSPSLSTNKKQNFSDIENFGNTETTSEKGFLRYDLCIENIDSSDL